MILLDALSYYGYFVYMDTRICDQRMYKSTDLITVNVLLAYSKTVDWRTKLNCC